MTTSLTDDPLARFFVEGGAIVGGATMLFSAAGFVLGSFARDLRGDVNPVTWAEHGARLGGTLGLTIVIYRTTGVT
jgi:hypothetical protein